MKRIHKIVSVFFNFVNVSTFISLYSCGAKDNKIDNIANTINKNTPNKSEKHVTETKQNENNSFNADKLLSLLSVARNLPASHKEKGSSTDEKILSQNKNIKDSNNENEETHSIEGIDSLKILQDITKAVKEKNDKNSDYEINITWSATGNVQVNSGKTFSVARAQDFALFINCIYNLKSCNVKIYNFDAILSAGQDNDSCLWKKDYFWQCLNQYPDLVNKKFIIMSSPGNNLNDPEKVNVKGFGIIDINYDDAVENPKSPRSETIANTPKRQNSFSKFTSYVKNKIPSPRKSNNKVKIKIAYANIFTIENTI